MPGDRLVCGIEQREGKKKCATNEAHKCSHTFFFFALISSLKR